MKAILVFVLLACLLFLPLFLSAQQIAPADSLSLQTKHKGCKAGKILSVAVPVSMIAYGGLSFQIKGIRRLDFTTREELMEDKSLWNSDLDDYLQFSPAAAAFGMKLCGVKSTHDASDMFALYALSNVLESGIIYSVKHLTSRERPDHSGFHSFPSGHTATAFVAAEFLHQEYKDLSPWISVGGYLTGMTIGNFRVYENRHWISDVIAGAGIGMLSTKVVYWTYPYIRNIFCKKNKELNTIILPSYHDGNFGVNLACTF